ncbi:MAG: hypothetical protein GY772_15365 [bacterium]|nr:hypothetical protein [bacterium]
MDFLEVFAGDAAITRGLQHLGYAGLALDARIDSAHDVLTPVGFAVLLKAAMEIRPRGLLWAAPPCSTWVWMSRHSSGRVGDRVAGNPNSAYVVSQNALVCRLLCILGICIQREVWFILEQPASSVMFEFAPVKRFAELHRVTRVKLQLGAYCGDSRKDIVLWGTAPYLPQVVRHLSPHDRERLQHERVHTTSVKTDCMGIKRVQGSASLKGTQSYPVIFGAAHALCFQSAQASGSAGASTPTAAAPEATAAAAGALAQPAVDIWEGEEPWFLEDIRLWNPNYWHSNVQAEGQLHLKRRRAD